MTNNSKEEAKDVTEENKCSNVAQDTGELQDKELDAVTGGLVTLSSIAILIGDISGPPPKPLIGGAVGSCYK